MPSPSTPQRPSNRGGARSTPTRTSAVDIGEAQGQHDTRDVREKIRRWHNEGGGVVVTPDVGASSEEEQKPAETKPQEMRQSTKRTRARRRGTTRVPRGDEDTRDILNSSAPKKRVISDGHWRKNRATPNSGSTASSPQKRMESPSTKYDQTRALFEERIERAKKEAAKRASSDAQLDDGIKVYAGPLKSSKSSGSRDDRSGSDGSVVEKKKKTTPRKKHSSKRRSSRESPKKKENVESGNKPYRDSTARHEDGWSTPPGDVPKSPEQKRRSQSPRRRKKPSAQLVPPKGGIFKPVIEAIDGSKKFFAKPEPPPEPIRGSRVEAWLSGTPDPFVEERTQLAERPAPPKSPSKRRPASKSDESDPGHRTQLSDETAENGRRRKPRRTRKRHGSSSPSEKKDSSKENESLPKPPKIPSREREGSPGSDSGLRRSGARKRPQSMYDDKKMSTLRESVEEALRESNSDRPCSSDGSDISHMERPPPLTLRRPFTGTGMHRLSTIPSVDTLATSNDSQTPTVKAHSREGSALAVRPEQDENLESESRDHFDANSLLGPAACGLKRRPTRHSDLMSALSGPVGRTRSIRSARSIRTNRSRIATATVGDLMRELVSDEASYMRELKTLVGGVIPVLLTSVLSKTDSAVAAGLFRPSSSPKDDDNFTRPIINMGVSLERLKALHKRIPLDNTDALLTWAQGAKKVYADYLKAWRLGFQDVVVNLAPPDADDPNSQNADAQSLLDGMSQDENGDVVDGDGERVDVAFLLKRPLVRLKYLSKTFKGLNYIQMSPRTEEISLTYRTLVVDARRRANEERARLEDDTAAAIDATRCRDLLTLGVSVNVTVDKKRRVRARDYFDLSLLHSTGQQIDCHSELLLRDNPAEKGPGGDLFISEVDHKGRWLLFPPIERERLSARRGDDTGEIVIMVREKLGESEKWHELISVKTDEEDICLEWVEMLGMDPLPPKIDVDHIKERKRAMLPDQETLLLPSMSTDKAPSAAGTNITPAEPATIVEQTTPHAKQQSEEARYPPLSSPSNSAVSRGRSRKPHPTIIPPSTPTKHNEVRSPVVLTEAMDLASAGSPTSLKRTKAQRRKSKGPPSPQTPTPVSPAPKAEPGRFYQQHPASEPARSVESSFTDSQPDLASPVNKPNASQGKRPIASVVRPTRRAHSPVPSVELPKIERLRKRDPTASTLSSPTRSEVNGEFFDFSDEEDPIWPLDNEDDAEDAPEPPPHRTPTRSSQKSRLSGSLVLSPPTPQFARHRRTSSPLKHEYEPSTATESSPSETSTVEHYEMYSGSETSEDELEDDDIDTPLPPIRGRHISATTPPKPVREDADDTLAPSNSASQAPYRTVPAQSSKASEATAAVWYWNDGSSGGYKLLKSCCHIVVTPGLIEAFETNNAGKRPLISLELTPMVGIRRGTGVDICIDSPPTERATFNKTGNIMFRPSTNPEDANRLYNLINHSRMNNPTYIALQNARGPFTTQPAPPVRQNSVRSTRFSGMFGLGGLSRKKSYRASAIAPPSTGLSESSIGTVSSAFSALKKFGANNKMFNVARSTLKSRTGSRGGSLYSTSTRSGDDYSPTSEPIEASNAAVGSIGLSNAKIRLYIRESQKRWGDLGRARLTILPVSPPGSRPGTSSATSRDSNGDYVSPDGSGFANEGASASSPAGPPSPLRSPARVEEKRILIHSKKDEAVLLDACLGESCFERIGRTGIAVSVWEEFDEVAKEGGVVGGSFRVYMIQMKNVAEAAYTFNIVGKNRY